MRKIGNGDILYDGFSQFYEENDPHRGDQTASGDLIVWAESSTFATILADPPRRFQNSTGKVAPEHKRLRRYAKPAPRRGINRTDSTYERGHIGEQVRYIEWYGSTQAPA